jgi:hypothetical protein
LKNGSPNTLFLLVDLFIGFAQNFFEMNRLTHDFSNGNCANPENVLTNGKKGIKIQKRIVHALALFKALCKFLVWLRIYSIYSNITGKA